MNKISKEGGGHNSNNNNAGGGAQVRVNYHRRKRASTALVTSRILKTGLAFAFCYAAISQAFFLKKWASQNPRSSSYSTNDDDDTPHDFFWGEGDAPDVVAKAKEIKFFEGVITTSAPILHHHDANTNTLPPPPPINKKQSSKHQATMVATKESEKDEDEEAEPAIKKRSKQKLPLKNEPTDPPTVMTTDNNADGDDEQNNNESSKNKAAKASEDDNAAAPEDDSDDDEEPVKKATNDEKLPLKKNESTDPPIMTTDNNNVDGDEEQNNNESSKNKAAKASRDDNAAAPEDDSDDDEEPVKKATNEKLLPLNNESTDPPTATTDHNADADDEQNNNESSKNKAAVASEDDNAAASEDDNDDDAVEPVKKATNEKLPLKNESTDPPTATTDKNVDADDEQNNNESSKNEAAKASRDDNAGEDSDDAEEQPTTKKELVDEESPSSAPPLSSSNGTSFFPNLDDKKKKNRPKNNHHQARRRRRRTQDLKSQSLPQLIPRTEVEFLDKFSDSWLIPKKNFMAINVDSINYVEQACFQIMVRQDARMTVDWTDFMVEHLSKWWSEFKILVDFDSQMFDHAIHIFHEYVEKKTKQIKQANLVGMQTSTRIQNNQDGGGDEEEPGDANDDNSKSPLHPTIAMIAYQTYESVFREREKLLSSFSLASTLLPLIQVGFGRIVIVGYKENDWKHALGALQLVGSRIHGSKLVVPPAMDPNNNNATNANNDDGNPATGLLLTVGHTEIAYVQIPNESWVKTEKYKINMPKGALFGVKAAIKGDLTKSIHNTSVEEWLGTTYDRQYWKYFYLTEPDTILHTKKHLLPFIRDGLDKGTMYMPHRLQPLPHEFNLPPAKKDAKEEEMTRGMNKHLSRRYQGRYLPGDIHPFSNVTILDPWNNKDDHCCDAGKFWPGRNEDEFGDPKQYPCGNWWWACGFEEGNKEVQESEPDKIREQHKRLLPYPMISLDSGTGIVFGPAEQGRRCFPSKEPCSLHS